MNTVQWTARLTGSQNAAPNGRRGGARSGDWSEHEIDLLRRFYAASGSGPVDLKRAAKLIGRDKPNVCRKARELGLTNQSRPKTKQLALVARPLEGEELRARMSDNAKRRIQQHGHPRGMLGKRHTAEVKAAIADHSRAMWADPGSKLNSEEMKQFRSDSCVAMISAGKMRGGGYSRGAVGRRADLDGRFFRSSWEANYARYLNWLKANGQIVDWEYEPKTFVFEVIKRGTRAYTPDFRVTFGSHYEWHEVKGWMDAKSATRLARMAKYYPEERVVVVGPEWFKAAARNIAPLIENWERKGARNQLLPALETGPAPPRGLTCPLCGEGFVATGSTHRFCSTRCRGAAKRARSKAELVDEAGQCERWKEAVGE